MPERFPSKVRDPADNNDPHKIGRREPRAEYLGWLHCRQINEIVVSTHSRRRRSMRPHNTCITAKTYAVLTPNSSIPLTASRAPIICQGRCSVSPDAPRVDIASTE